MGEVSRAYHDIWHVKCAMNLFFPKQNAGFSPAFFAQFLDGFKEFEEPLVW
jgi:hypothetical protein